MTKRSETWTTRSYRLNHKPMDPQPLRLYGINGSREVKDNGDGTWTITHKTRRI